MEKTDLNIPEKGPEPTNDSKKSSKAKHRSSALVENLSGNGISVICWVIAIVVTLGSLFAKFSSSIIETKTYLEQAATEQESQTASPLSFDQTDTVNHKNIIQQ